MTNRPKGKLFALLAIFVAIGLVTATGAFTTVQADRTANVATAGDSSALLGITDLGVAGSGGYIDDSNNAIVINIDSTSGPGDVNDEGVTWINATLRVTNNGPNAVDFWISLDQGSGTFSMWNSTSTTDYDLSANHANLGTGADVTIHMQVDTTGADTFPTTVTFHAEDNTDGATSAPGSGFDPST